MKLNCETPCYSKPKGTSAHVHVCMSTHKQKKQLIY